MTFFTPKEFNDKYGVEIPEERLWLIEAASEMIYSQIGLRYRGDWYAYEEEVTNDGGLRNSTTEIIVHTNVPLAIRDASMEQCRFLLEYDIPFLDNRGEIKAGNMISDLKTDYSTLALRILANAGYQYRGNPINQNMGMDLPF